LMIGLDGSFTAVLLAHLVFVLPYAFLALSDPWQRQDPRYARVAASMGASRARIFFRVQLPMLTRPVLVTLAVALAVSVGQYLPTLMIGAGRVVTVTTESVALASGGNRQITAVYALLQLLIPFAGFAVAAAIPAVLFKNRTALRLDD
jgi:putative thiamine transport system permease protein